jgi:hypothetical protein
MFKNLLGESTAVTNWRSARNCLSTHELETSTPFVCCEAAAFPASFA